jgi:hypothetical protein
MTPPNASVAALFTDDEFHSRLIEVAKTLDDAALEARYLMAQWPAEERDDPAYFVLSCTAEDALIAARRLRNKHEAQA